MKRSVWAVCLGLALCLAGCQSAAGPVPAPAEESVPTQLPAPVPSEPVEPAPWPEDAVTPYAAVLDRDLSQVKPEDDTPMEAFPTSFDWEYTLIDVSGDGEPELFVRMTDEHGLARMFHAEDGVIQCWYYQDVEMNYTWEPLSDGSILVTYDYGGGISHSIYLLDESGDLPELPAESLYHRYEVYVPEQTIFWSHNNEEIDEETYEGLLQEVVEDKRIQTWTPLP